MTTCKTCMPINDANRLGLDYRAEAGKLPWTGEIYDVHLHLNDIESARLFFEVADLFNVTRVWTMTPLEQVDALQAEFGSRTQFIAVPNFRDREREDTFTTDFLHRMERFREKGSRIVKLWSAPRGRDFSPHLLLDAPIRHEAIKLAQSLGMAIMAHVADPDTWFATKYADATIYGSKASHHEALERMLEQYHEVPWLVAHMGGHPEDLDHLQELLNKFPHLHLDTSATKWMVRELSKHPQRLKEFIEANPGRILFGTDIVTNKDNMDFDLYASRFWALRTLMETDYVGLSPIVDPDLHMVDPTLPEKSVADLRGAAIDPAALHTLYVDAAQQFYKNYGLED